jgi:glycosyltransferase involved in cell wall biosynthesis
MSLWGSKHRSPAKSPTSKSLANQSATRRVGLTTPQSIDLSTTARRCGTVSATSPSTACPAPSPTKGQWLAFCQVGLRVCFYAAVADRELLERVEFYRQDLRALRALGHEVRIATRPRELIEAADVFWIWWPTSGVPAAMWSRLRRKPCVLVTALSDRDKTASGLPAKGPLARFAFSCSLAAATLTLATSEDTRAGLSRRHVRALRTAPLGVDTTFYRPRKVERERFLLTITHLTSDNVQRKRIVDVVRAAAELRVSIPELRWLIVGERAEAAPLIEEEIRRLGLQDTVILLGTVSAVQKRDLLARAAIYVQPTHYEAFGMAIAEAMACATPVVSNRVGNVPTLVGDAGLLLPESANPSELAAALVGALARKDLSAMGSSARARIEQHYSYEARTMHVSSALEEVTRTMSARGLAGGSPETL